MGNWKYYLRVSAVYILCLRGLNNNINNNGALSNFVGAFSMKTISRTNCASSLVSLIPSIGNRNFQTFRRRKRTACASTISAEEEETASASSLSSNTNYGENNINLYTADTLDGRLLCASQCAYDVSNRCYFRGVGFKAGTVAKRITRGNINSVLVGQTVDGIVISFRGTVAESPLDWLQNAALFLANVDKFPDDVKLHTGFYRAVKALWKPLAATLRDMTETYYEEQRKILKAEISNREDDDQKISDDDEEKEGISEDDIPPPKIYLTGHSKGGAMASIAAIMLRQSSSLPNPTYVCTFASAKPGNAEFRDYYNKEVNQTSYEAYLDIIPFLPPAKKMMSQLNDEMAEMVDSILWSETTSQKKDKFTWSYEIVGERKYIDENAEIMDVSQELDDIRIKDIEDKTFLSLKKFRSAHCSSCPGLDSDESGSTNKSECDGLYFAGVACEICDQCTL